ncbi:DNA topoisomerase IV subunit B [Buchananella hordeovulneris]|uniref:DNA topoisomerase (ATP-hydrolyzing) n=1 Tax=Buchananella hordeovulneris TaxID=52770 RepID=A0A1Q5PYH0_9ACTO|nr:DNA topoisomerase IV subunit B [Buchananella hordeovulneris]
MIGLRRACPYHARVPQTSDYSARHLQVLEGLEAVRKRPAMYIGSTDERGVMHCVWEIIDNSVDEALEGHATTIRVTVHRDGSVEVIDDGRGIPVDIVPSVGLTGVEVVYTKLHAGGKFGGSSYGSAGGLHGVGASVVNALSQRVDVEVTRAGKVHAMSFRRGEPGIFADSGAPQPDAPFTPFEERSELRIIGKAKRGVSGTRVRFWPDPQIFPQADAIDLQRLVDRARQTSFLVPGLTIVVRDERPGAAATMQPSPTTATPSAMAVDSARADAGIAEDSPVPTDLTDYPFDAAADDLFTDLAPGEGVALAASAQTVPLADDAYEETFRNDGGVVDFVDYLAPDAAVSDTWHVVGQATFTESVQQLGADGKLRAVDVERTCRVDCAVRWGVGYDTTVRSFVNIIATPKGGTHLTGFEQGLVKAVRSQLEAQPRRFGIKPKDPRIEKDDMLAGLTAVVTVRLAEPQFEGQTKEVLGTPQVRAIVAKVVTTALGEYLGATKGQQKTQAGAVLEKIVGEMRARVSARTQKEISRRKNALENSSLPTKLADCRANDVEGTELFIVEGDSALGTAKLARSSDFQALLPIRGKILNVQKSSQADMLANAECAAIIQVIGAGAGRSFDLSAARYGKVILMTDADVDGAHIRTLLLTLFFRYMRPLIEAGRVYAAVPPLHRLEVPGAGRRKTEYIYTYSEAELHQQIARLKRLGRAFKEPIQRYKGLGEMDAHQLAETTMDPAHRTLRRITIADEAALIAAERTFDLLMGSVVPPRREFIIEGAASLDYERIDA